MSKSAGHIEKSAEKKLLATLSNRRSGGISYLKKYNAYNKNHLG